MKIVIFLLSTFITNVAIAQNTNESDMYINDIYPPYEEEVQTRSARTGSAYDFYNNLNNWIPYLTPSVPLKNPPITNIEISFHVFLDNNGGNNIYTDMPEGRNRLLYVFNFLNEIYSGHPDGPSDPVSGVVELPAHDTRIRFTLGDNNERIYFYKNTSINKEWDNVNLYNYIQTNYPERNNKLNVYFTGGHYSGYLLQENIVITNGGSGYTSPPTITFKNSGNTTLYSNATANAIIKNGKIAEIQLVKRGEYSGYDPPQIVISGGGGSGASAIVTRLSGGATGYANPISEYYLQTISHVVMCHTHDTNEWTTSLTLPHELGHCLGLAHTYCGGGISAICCSGTCGQGCVKNCDNSNYLSDIFGSCLESTCPHIVSWSDPFDNTSPNAEKITNNVMGGTYRQTYFSPMQVGQMHRTLALYSPRKYVKKETYSSTPLVINNNQVWDFNLKLYRSINITSGGILTLASTFEFPYNGNINVNSGTALVIEGTIKLQDNNKIIVRNGGSLKIVSGSSIDINGNGYIEIQSGGYLCIEPGSSIKLNDINSFIYMRPGSRTGVNTSILSSGSCTSTPSSYNITGNGRIKDYRSDLYIQNETISTDRYYMGKNIYIGKNVTTLLPQGNVVIKNNAKIIFDAAENVYFDAGFECELGASYEVKK